MTRLLFRTLSMLALVAGLGTGLSAQTLAFLKLDGVDGNAATAGYKDQICITSFSWGVERELNTTGGGGGAGVARQTPMLLGKEIGPASPLLLDGVVRGKTYSDATLSLVREDPGTGDIILIATYEMENILLEKYLPGVEAGMTPREVFSLLPEQITYTVFDPTGAISTSWNFSTNAPR